MKREDFIKNFLKVVEQRLIKDLPNDASEGVLILESYEITSRISKHILVDILTTKDELCQHPEPLKI